MNIADRIEKFFDEALLSEDGLLFSSLKKDSMSSWKPEDFNAADLLPIIPGYEKMDFSDFMNYENTGMVQGGSESPRQGSTDIQRNMQSL